MNPFGHQLLNVVLYLPLAGAVLCLLLPKNRPGLVAKAATAIAAADLLASLPLWFGWSAAPVDSYGFRFVLDTPWIRSLGARYIVGVDGISMLLVLLTTVLGFLAILSSWTAVSQRQNQYYAYLLVLQTGMVGVFVSLDTFLFYVFWEVMLIPMYFLIGMWGGPRRIYASVKFFLFTLFGSVLMLVGIIALYSHHAALTGVATFDIRVLQSMGTWPDWMALQVWIWLAFFLGFAIKVPMFPFHTWLPDAHVEAPTAGSLMLASVMLKMGTYGLVRFCLPLFPNAAHRSAGWIAALAIIGIIYGALVALVQPNMKKLVAYSSVSHLGFVVLGIFSFTQQGMDGAVYQMLNHGISTGALFILVGYLYERRHSLEIAAYGGVATPAPNLAIVFLITTLASIGLPTLNNFVGEYLVLQGTAQANFMWTVFAALGVILSACYMLWLYQRTFYGRASEAVTHHVPDLSPREWAIMIPLLILMVWMGTYTQTFLPAISAQNAAILKQTQPLQTERVAIPAPTTAEVRNAR